jgi:hypothetical protein
MCRWRGRRCSKSVIPARRNGSPQRAADWAGNGQEAGNRSAVSLVIEDMGLPNSDPVSENWYHKVALVDHKMTDRIAKELVEDLDARWCSHLESSVGGCPKESCLLRHKQCENC